jgi:hypothetical protein
MRSSGCGLNVVEAVTPPHPLNDPVDSLDEWPHSGWLDYVVASSDRVSLLMLPIAHRIDHWPIDKLIPQAGIREP